MVSVQASNRGGFSTMGAAFIVALAWSRLGAWVFCSGL